MKKTELKEILKDINLSEKKKKKKDRCHRKADQAYGTKTSAYKSGAIVKCRKGMIWKKKTNEEIFELIDESLRDWFKKEDWVRIDTQGNITGPCGTMKDKKRPSRCLPRSKANSLTKAERAATAKKKKASSKQFVKNTKKSKVSFKNRK